LIIINIKKLASSLLDYDFNFSDHACIIAIHSHHLWHLPGLVLTGQIVQKSHKTFLVTVQQKCGEQWGLLQNIGWICQNLRLRWANLKKGRIVLPLQIMCSTNWTHNLD